MGRRRSSAPVLLVIFGVLAVVLAALAPLAESSSRHHHHHGHHAHVQNRGHGIGEGEQSGAAAVAKARGSAWPCCDSCGGCTKSDSPQCRCMDAVPGGCHPACRDCVQSALAVHPPVYQCMDRVPNFCQRRCSAIAAH